MDAGNFVPVPHDIPLPLPGNEAFFKVLLVVSFLVHILFVNLMVGGSLLTLVFEMLGMRNKYYDRLAHEIAKTITVNKSLAVVLGVAPLLLINVLYTVHFYSANALTGNAWISVIPLVAVAFLLAYLHKYSWDWEFMRTARELHLALGWLYAGIFLFVPFIFLANINLMLFPEKWMEVQGFFSTLFVGNVFPRYAHFLLACFAVTALFLTMYLTRASYPLEEKVGTDFTRPQLRRLFYGIAFAATGANFIVGPLVAVTLPSKGWGVNMFGVLSLGILLACGAMYYLYEEINAPDELVGHRYGAIVLLFALTVASMGTTRHFYRDNALEDHQQLVAEKTEAYMEQVKLAAMELEKADASTSVASTGGKGGEIFKMKCQACHAQATQLVGPSLKEIAELYGDDVQGVADWIKKPGKRRPNMMQMPAFPMPDSDLQKVAKYVLEQGTAASQ